MRLLLSTGSDNVPLISLSAKLSSSKKTALLDDFIALSDQREIEFQYGLLFLPFSFHPSSSFGTFPVCVCVCGTCR